MTVPTAFSHILSNQPLTMRVRAECPDCGTQHRMEKPQKRGAHVWLLCHRCETVFVIRVPR